MSAREVRELLRDARQIVAEGWCQGSYQDMGKFCALGALGEAGGRHPADAYTDAHNAVADVTHGNIVAFNDTPGRTQAEVIEVFSKAIEATL